MLEPPEHPWNLGIRHVALLDTHQASLDLTLEMMSLALRLIQFKILGAMNQATKFDPT
jgi:hypothetical protein